MIFDYKFNGSSSINNTGHATSMNFVPDASRQPVFFSGKLNKKIAFREAISALHDVVISDLRFKPKDKTAYKEWVAEQEKLWLSEYMAGYQIEQVRARITQLKEELRQVQQEKAKIMRPFYNAKTEYFKYLYQNDKDAWIVLDPVITVHPDEVFFECFSQDESSYGKLSCSYNVFKELNEFQCGTTNVDYSEALYGSFQKIRDYKETEFTIDPSGFETQTTNETVYKEVKIDLPDSWVRGFLQVSAAMTLPAASFELHPMDIFSLCQYLRRFKEKEGPRALRFILEPGKPVQLVIEPWYETLTFYRSVYTGPVEKTIRIWGRRRLMILERLIPVAKTFKVVLLGSGLPSFFLADLGDMVFTLGLSGWTANDWSHAGNFDLMAPRGKTDIQTKEQVFNQLKETWYASSDELAKKLDLDSSTVATALTAYIQAGRVVYDIHLGLYRVRELTQEPIDISLFRFGSELEKEAHEYIEKGSIKISTEIKDDTLRITGKINTSEETLSTLAVIDKDQRLIDGSCDCAFFRSNQLKKGPCEHILATRMKLQQ